MRDSFVNLSGNLTRDPEEAITASGGTITRFGLAVNRSKRDGEGWVEETSFFDVSVLDQQMATNTMKSLSKGARVTVTGWLQQRTVEQDDGTKRSYVNVVADDIAVSLRWANVDIHRNPKKDEVLDSKVSTALTDEPKTRDFFDEDAPF